MLKFTQSFAFVGFQIRVALVVITLARERGTLTNEGHFPTKLLLFSRVSHSFAPQAIKLNHSRRMIVCKYGP